MSDDQMGGSGKETTSPSLPDDKVPPGMHNRIATILGQMLDHSDTIIHGIIGIGFLLGALFALGYSFGI